VTTVTRGDAGEKSERSTRESSALRRRRVLVVTRTKNRNLLLKRAIESVLRQTFQEWFHVIVNDGGDVEGLDLLLGNYVSRYAGRCAVIHNPVSFTMEAASNVGLLASDGEYVSIHDDDDSWEPSFLERMVAVLDERAPDPRVGGVVCHATVVLEEISNGTILECGRHLFSDYPSLGFYEMLARNWFPPICLLIRRSALESVGAFDAMLPVLGDWEFNIRLMRHFELEVVPEALARYHHRPSGAGDNGNSVYKDNSVHRAYNQRLVDRFVREDLDSGRASFAELMMLSRLSNEMKEIEARLGGRLDTLLAKVDYLISKMEGR